MTTHNQSFFVFHSRRVVLMASPSSPDPRKSSSSPFLCRYRCVHLRVLLATYGQVQIYSSTWHFSPPYADILHSSYPPATASQPASPRVLLLGLLSEFAQEQRRRKQTGSNWKRNIHTSTHHSCSQQKMQQHTGGHMRDKCTEWWTPIQCCCCCCWWAGGRWCSSQLTPAKCGVAYSTLLKISDIPSMSPRGRCSECYDNITSPSIPFGGK